MDSKKLFTRDATGLVREASLADIFQFNAVSMTGMGLISVGLLEATLMTSGNGIWEAILLGFVLALPINLTYYTLSVTVPRSGGDYVYNSRLLHPSLGVMGAGLTGIMGTLVLAVTFGSTFWITQGLAPLLTAFGQSSLASAVVVPTNFVTIGILTTILFAAILILKGTKFFYRLNIVLYGIAIIGGVVGALFMLSVGHNGFVQKFDTFAQQYGTNSTGIISTAHSLGYTLPSSGPYSVLIASAFFGTTFYWATQSSWLGGEIKNIKRTQLFGALGASAFWLGLSLFAIVTAYFVVGPDLISASSYLNFFQPQAWTIPTVSFFALYANIAASNSAVAVLISLAFLFGFLTVLPWSFIIFSRAIFSLSFDRLLPTAFADINERFRTPVKALALFAGLTIILLLLTLVGGTIPSLLFTYGVAINVVYMLTFLVSSVSLILLPYRHKNLFEVSPFKRRVGSIPIISIVGVLSAIVLVVYEYVFIVNSKFYGVTSQALEVMIGFIIFFPVLYFIIRAVQKSRSVQIDLIYKEIPPE